MTAQIDWLSKQATRPGREILHNSGHPWASGLKATMNFGMVQEKPGWNEKGRLIGGPQFL